jgi:phosphoglucomutase
MTAEMALYHLSHGQSLLDRLNTLYETYGYFGETQVSRYFKGESGIAVMARLMARLRTSPPASLGGRKVVSVKDYKDGTTLDMKTGARQTNIALPSSNVLQFICAGGSVITARPSGTEPKIKFYASCHSAAGQKLDVAKKSVYASLDAIKKEIVLLVEGDR